MNMSFYVGALGADASQKKLDVISNNLANINNNGFKPKNAVFSELINYNLNDSPEAKTELQAGAGTTVVRTNTEFTTAAFVSTGQPHDYAIGTDNGFFKLLDPKSGEITFSRNGHFHAGEFPNESGKRAENFGSGIREEGKEETKQKIGVYKIPYPSRLLNKGDNEFAVRPDDRNNTDSLLEKAVLEEGTLESSGTDMAKEMTRLIESQRAFTYALKMVQTSDEVEGTINQLRG